MGGAVDAFLPAEVDKSTLPPAGGPNTFVGFPGQSSSPNYKTYHFHVNFATPGNSTFTTFATPAAAGYTALCPGTRACVPQKGVSSSNNLDGIGDRLMFRLAYRNFGDHESVVGTYGVSSGGVADFRWFELRNVFQQHLSAGYDLALAGGARRWTDRGTSRLGLARPVPVSIPSSATQLGWRPIQSTLWLKAKLIFMTAPAAKAGPGTAGAITAHLLWIPSMTPHGGDLQQYE